MRPVTVYYNLMGLYAPKGSYLSVSQGIVGPNGKPPAGLDDYVFNGHRSRPYARRPSRTPHPAWRRTATGST